MKKHVYFDAGPSRFFNDSVDYAICELDDGDELYAEVRYDDLLDAYGITREELDRYLDRGYGCEWMSDLSAPMLRAEILRQAAEKGIGADDLDLSDLSEDVWPDGAPAVLPENFFTEHAEDEYTAMVHAAESGDPKALQALGGWLSRNDPHSWNGEYYDASLPTEPTGTRPLFPVYGPDYSVVGYSWTRPEPETKTIYTVMDSPRKGDGDVWEDHPTFDRLEAVANAKRALGYLTRSERAKRKVEVVRQDVQVFPNETAQEVMDRLIDADEWGALCNAEEITEG